MAAVLERPKPPVRRRPGRPGQWLLLLVLTLAATAGLSALGLPAALLLGPIVAAVALALGGGSIQFGRTPYILAQAVVGCLIARAASPAVLPTLAASWHLFAVVILAGLGASAAMGWLLYRLDIMPGATGIWGASPGGAEAMVVMADACGADARLVAFMQYLRVLCVALAASLVARLAVPAGAVLPLHAATVWFPPPTPGWGTAAGLILLGGLVGLFTRIPAGAMLVPMLVGAALRLAGATEIELPPWLLAASYAGIGWRVGLGFTRQVAVYAARALPAILAAITALIAFCGGLSWLLSRLTGMDGLTAYLAASPGGMDSVAVIAASSPGVDFACVMTMQTMRFFLVVLLAPAMARFLAARADARSRDR
ncbi:AbrB family transcriptional regulator [Desulfovibrio sp. TomC]|uniref:AbrB family transcriptional regulator n=1 Tax=Desulfovibrio sp. TomC TaxID=1562888 RepID=UPI0005752628|nr:AbrB family transcriptional regulator [Desulfovibrio sp. TomC]KHK01618.1 putative transport protein [Desulfovibrio sp. TomC]